ncbi:hypothetical protein DPMN_105728 [Dreissena polymorpha]|uniref:Uncharacterized protein n=1 Tax=Dreissena polymorpha TaxID=45954 RepID=A0A9D4QI24_DREPO|nr:hypothetical protein DPMN_105728 [Dreissena polymorpha]
MCVVDLSHIYKVMFSCPRRNRKHTTNLAAFWIPKRLLSFVWMKPKLEKILSRNAELHGIGRSFMASSQSLSSRTACRFKQDHIQWAALSLNQNSP